MQVLRRALVLMPTAVGGALAAGRAAAAVDNSAIGRPEFREHKATYGLVYRLPRDVTEVPDRAPARPGGSISAWRRAVPATPR